MRSSCLLQSLSLSLLTSRIHSCLFSDRRCTTSSKFFDRQVSSVSTEELLLPRHAHCNGHSFLLNSLSLWNRQNRESFIQRRRSSDPGHLSSHSALSSYGLFTSLVLWRLFCLSLSTTSGPGPGELPGFWGSMVYRHASSLERDRVTTTATVRKLLRNSFP